MSANDAQGNPVPGQAVTLTAGGTGNALSPSSGSTGAAGTLTASLKSTVAQLKALTATVAGGDAQRQRDVHGLLASASGTVDALSAERGERDGKRVRAASSLTATGVATGRTTRCRACRCRLASTGSNNTLTPTSGTTNASGQLTATLASTTAEPKTVTASFSGHLGEHGGRRSRRARHSRGRRSLTVSAGLDHRGRQPRQATLTATGPATPRATRSAGHLGQRCRAAARQQHVRHGDWVDGGLGDLHDDAGLDGRAGEDRDGELQARPRVTATAKFRGRGARE